MNITMVGTGYVGLVTGACFADMGNHVTCLDIDETKIATLKRGESPIYEPGLSEMIQRNAHAGRLEFTTDRSVAYRDATIIFICVGTPSRDDGSADLQYVLKVADDIAVELERGGAAAPIKTVVVKSTVPVGTSHTVRDAIRARTKVPFRIADNPEFLKEGDAIMDFMKPDRVVCGVDDSETGDVMRTLYDPFVRQGNPIFILDVRSAEMVKYASNAMLACKISFINEIANLCERYGADIGAVREGMCADKRIGKQFLYPGLGYGGSCLTGKHTVLARRAGRTSLVRLDELFTNSLDGIQETPDLEVLSWAPGDSAPQFRPATGISRRWYEGDGVEIRTKMGRRVVATSDHPMVLLDVAGQHRVFPAGMVCEGDWLPVAVGCEKQDERSTDSAPAPALVMDILTCAATAEIADEQIIVRLADAGLRALGRLDATTVEQALGRLDATTVEQAIAQLAHPRGRNRASDILRGGVLRLDEARLLGLPIEDATFGTARNGTYLPRVLEMNERFWRVLGLYLAEGHVSADGRRRRIAWSFHPTDEPELVEEVASFWQSIGVRCDVRRMSTTMQVSVSSRILASIIESLKAGGNCYTHRIPDLAWTATESCKRALLSGMWHGDGSWSKVRGGPSIVLEYGTVSALLADGIVRLLGDIGVIARVRARRVAKSERTTYRLTVSSASNIERVPELTCASERDEALLSIAKRSKRTAPTGSRQVGESAATAVRVVSVRKRQIVGPVFSLEVPGAHTFVTNHGLVVHNCFPKDTQAVVAMGKSIGFDCKLNAAVHNVNQDQRAHFWAKIQKELGDDLRGKCLAFWGVAFKPKTDDIREAPSLALMERALSAGAKVRAYDPVAMEHLATEMPSVGCAKDLYSVLDGADALIICTEWAEFRAPDFQEVRRRLATPTIFDGRNLYRLNQMSDAGFTYASVGRQTVRPRQSS